MVDADAAAAERLRLMLCDSETLFFTVHRADGLSEAVALLESRRFDAVLADVGGRGDTETAHLSQLLAKAGETPVILTTNIYEKARALEAVRAGAQDYVQKSQLNPNALERILLNAIERHRARTRAEVQYAVSKVLTESETIPEARVRILQLLCDFLECGVGQIWDLDKHTGNLSRSESWHVPSHDYSHLLAVSQGMCLKKGTDLPGLALSNGEPAWLSDLGPYSHLPHVAAAFHEGLRSALAFPITLGTEIFGVMEFFSSERRGPDEELLKVFTNIGNQVGQFMARELAEEEKERLTKEHLLILESTSQGIYGVDLSGHVTFINRAAAAMLGYAPEDVLGKDAHALFHHSHPDGSPSAAQSCAMLRVRHTGRSCRLDNEYLWTADGTGFAVEYSAFPIVKDQKITGAVICFNDIRERKKLEVELRAAQKLEAVGRLAAGIAHEINTPIQFVGDNARFLQDAFRDAMKLEGKYAQLCLESEHGLVSERTRSEVKAVMAEIDWTYLQAEVPKAVAQVLDGVDRVATIVRAMKEFSHVDQSADMIPADLNKAVESTLIVARNELKYVADVETDFGPLSPVVCRLGDLNQVFLNLLINAAHAIGNVVEASGSKGQIRIRTRQDEDWVQIDIQDTGTGIPEEIRDRIFDPFFTTKRVGEGTGQGLALARAIVVEKHGGTITFDTVMGKGTTFHVRLPANGQPAAKVAAAS